MAVTDRAIARRIRDTLEQRGPGKTCCPSDIARSFGDDWRALMPRVRAVAAALVKAGEIEVTQRDRIVDIATASGPVRLGLPSTGD